jgi:hypothetical protein
MKYFVSIIDIRPQQAGHLDFICHLNFDIWNLFSIWCLEFRIWSGATAGSSPALSRS